jgi:hypothetical protein
MLIESIDKDENSSYGIPFHMRFKDLNIEYNQIFSQISKAIKILQTVWKTNSDLPTPDTEIRFDPDTVNYVGKDGVLEQVIRELNIDPEMTYLSNLSKLIHTSAQCPDYTTELEGIGKVNSAVALELISAPLVELTTRIRNEYKNNLEELVGKVASCIYLFSGATPPEFDFDISMNEQIMPADKTSEVDLVIKLVQNNIFTPEEAKTLISPLFKLV